MKSRLAVIVDVDGTLTEINQKRKEAIEAKDWDTFHALSEFEPPNVLVLDMVKDFQRQSHFIFLITGRPEKWRKLTQDWLTENEVPCDALLMRNDDNHEPSYAVKKAYLDALIQSRFKIVCALEDRPQDVQMYRAANVPVVEIINGRPSDEESE